MRRFMRLAVTRVSCGVLFALSALACGGCTGGGEALGLDAGNGDLGESGGSSSSYSSSSRAFEEKPDGGTSAVSDEGGGAAPGTPRSGHGQAVWLHASGSAIVDAQDNPVRLFGVNRSGTEFACVQNFGIFSGPSDVASVTAIQSWKANAVRIPLNEDCWLGINGVNPLYSGPAYQAAIVAYVETLLQAGMYPIVDLHWTAPGSQLAMGQEPMPDADHSVDFWTSVAGTFKGDANVVFELFNEPWPDNNQDTDEAWSCWKNGGTCASISYTVAGMQSLVTAVRQAGAGNLLLLGGVDYSNGLSHWVANVPSDPLNNLAAAWHVYPENPCTTSSCWETNAGTVAASFPIVATEVGDSACDATFPTGVMTWLDGKGQSYLGWTWDTFGAACGNYSLVTDYTGTPNGAYGLAFKSHFATVAP